jgi:hypothetical protein
MRKIGKGLNIKRALMLRWFAEHIKIVPGAENSFRLTIMRWSPRQLKTEI